MLMLMRMLDQTISSSQAWTRATLAPRDWIVPLAAEAAAELDETAGAASSDAESLDPARFKLDACLRVMAEVRARLVAGGGLAVVDRIPVERYTPEQNRAIGWLLARALGQVVDQKWTGTRIYDVKDSGQPLAYGVRRSVTNLEQPFHTDAGWLTKTPAFVGLFCLESAPSGGMSRFTSLVTAHNVMLRRHPRLLERLYAPFAWDRQAEHPAGEAKVSRQPVFEYDGSTLAARWYEDYVHNGYRIAGEPVDEPGREALHALRTIIDDPEHRVEFRVERGQFQYINNRQFAHCRTAFVDAGDGSRSRHMLRLWNRDEGSPRLDG